MFNRRRYRKTKNEIEYSAQAHTAILDGRLASVAGIRTIHTTINIPLHHYNRLLPQR